MKIKNNLHETKVEALFEDGNNAYFFIHGFGSSNRVWDFIVPQLTGSKFFIPFPGHVGSKFHGRESYDFVSTIAHIFESINQKNNLGNKRKVLIVHSASSAIILYYLLLYPNIFSEIIFVTPAVNLEMPLTSPLYPLVSIFANQHSDLFWDLAFNKSREVLQDFNWFREIFLRGGTLHHKLPSLCTDEWVSRYFRETDHSYEILKLIVISARKTSEDPSDRLYTLLKQIYNGSLRDKYRTLVIGSRNDSLISYENHKACSVYLNSKLETFTESSHLPMIEEHEKMIKTIKGFLND